MAELTEEDKKWLKEEFAALETRIAALTGKLREQWVERRSEIGGGLGGALSADWSVAHEVERALNVRPGFYEEWERRWADVDARLRKLEGAA